MDGGYYLGGVELLDVSGTAPPDGTRMGQQLTGLGLFSRAPSETVPHLTSIAIDLGLMPFTPHADKPWACRVTVSLMRPGTDGLAQDRADIEQLTALGHDLLKRLGPTTVFAAAVTASGERTWLLYTGGADAMTVVARIRQATRLAFAEQADYVPKVSVEPDPAWAVYRSLYPLPAEQREIIAQRTEAKAVAAAKAATQAAVASLRHGDGSASVRYQLTFPTSGARTVFLQRLTTAPYRPETATGPRAASSEEDGFPLAVLRDNAVDVGTIHKAERWLIHEATRVGGRYDGWSLPDAGEGRMRLVA
jgi:hypothetical protein